MLLAALFGCSGYSLTHVESVWLGGEAVKGGVHCFSLFSTRIWQNLGTPQQKTRLAVTLALGEISIVESSVASWNELTAITQARVREDN